MVLDLGMMIWREELTMVELVMENRRMIQSYTVCILSSVVVSILKCSSVNGNPVSYSKVTEEDHELMTPDEYTAYFEIMQSLSMS